MPASHPKGYLEAFATLYDEAADMIVAVYEGGKRLPELTPFSIEDGVNGVRLIDTALWSSAAGDMWTAFGGAAEAVRM